MSDTPKLSAEVRTSFGKGAARQLRRAGKIPAVIYGHGSDPRHVALPTHAVSLIVRRSNALIDIEIEGTDELVLVKDVQRDPVQRTIEHIDLVTVKRGEKVEVEVPLHLEGEALSPAVANLDIAHLLILALATNIPERIVVNVEGLEEGSQVAAGDVVLPEGAELVTEADVVLVTVETPAEEPEQGAEPVASVEADAADAAAATAAE